MDEPEYDPTLCEDCGEPLDEGDVRVCGHCHAERMYDQATDDKYAEEAAREYFDDRDFADGIYPTPDDSELPF